MLKSLFISVLIASAAHGQEPAGAHCASPAVELAGADPAFAARFAKSAARRSATEANVREAFRNACAKRLLHGATIPKLDGVSSERLFLENQPNANVTLIEAGQLRDGSWRLILGYPFVAADGSANVPTAAEIEEAIYCTVVGATPEEQERRPMPGRLMDRVEKHCPTPRILANSSPRCCQSALNIMAVISCCVAEMAIPRGT